MITHASRILAHSNISGPAGSSRFLSLLVSALAATIWLLIMVLTNFSPLSVALGLLGCVRVLETSGYSHGGHRSHPR